MMGTIRVTAAQAIVRYLAAQYTERDGVEQPFFAGMFGIFGHGNVTGIGQALEEHRDLLTYYRPQNEQAMVHTAAAFAKMTNRLQTFACTSSIGPGATNMVTGAALATINRLPVLLLPGDIFANRRPHPVLQGLEHPSSQDLSVNDAFRPVSKYFDRIYRPEQLVSSLPEAMRVLTDPAETGAVTLALPEDVQTEAFDVPETFFAKRVWKIRRALPPHDALEDAARLIAEAERPLIVGGGGVIYSDASEALDDFATQCGIPVSETQAGKGALRWDHPWNAGPIGANGGIPANRLARDADLVIAVGTRLGDFVTASKTAFQNPDVRFIGINTCSLDAHKMNALSLVGDARATLEALQELVLAEGTVRDITAYHSEIEALQNEWTGIVDDLRAVDDTQPITQAQVIGLVNDAAGPKDVVINAAGSMPGDLLKLWRSQDPKSYHLEYGYSCMGYEIPAGIGVKMADPDREVFVLIGDGSYLMLNTEIVTAVQEGIKLVIVLVDNGGFQSIHGLQMSSGTPSFGNELRFRDEEQKALAGSLVPVDYVSNAESMGARGIRATNAEELRAALDEAKSETRTTMVYIQTDENARVPNFEGWWDVPIAEVSQQDSVKQARRQYEADIQKQRVIY
ncbi:MAG TPA: 3D-(3,5/4)-trihydroxycyclohexane-1,2-dione acylhydrolase (decyclizing) [Thermomicrobiales bacterium]|nr:3D-(3,5/4)-trihydroxycyclohexane-1,2-dione acylhydrolase (decyclizing) [Thermomicrobiales bacterium]